MSDWAAPAAPPTSPSLPLVHRSVVTKVHVVKEADQSLAYAEYERRMLGRKLCRITHVRLYEAWEGHRGEPLLLSLLLLQLIRPRSFCFRSHHHASNSTEKLTKLLHSLSPFTFTLQLCIDILP